MSAYEWQTRQNALIGEDATEKLARSSVLLFGVGGVGSFCAEGLIRAGIGKLTVIDSDVVDVSNINRQLIAYPDTVGQSKVELAVKNAKRINPQIDAVGEKLFVTKENADEMIARYSPDIIIDAIDNVSAKIAICQSGFDRNIPVISSMGTGNKLDPSHFKITDISKTSVCPLARVMRTELKKRNITGIYALWSDELPRKVGCNVPASISFVPSVAGLMIAGKAVELLTGGFPES